LLFYYFFFNQVRHSCVDLSGYNFITFNKQEKATSILSWVWYTGINLSGMIKKQHHKPYSLKTQMLLNTCLTSVTNMLLSLKTTPITSRQHP